MLLSMVKSMAPNWSVVGTGGGGSDDDGGGGGAPQGPAPPMLDFKCERSLLQS